jgi:hypothetical protein
MKTLKINLKPVVIFSLLTFFYTYCTAQYSSPPDQQPYSYNEPKQDVSNFGPSGYASVNFGFATPEGGFANSTGGSYGGYAMPGEAFHFSLGIPINHSNFGVAFMLGNYNNQYDLNTYSANNSEYPVYPDQDFYSETSLMGGLYLTFPVGIVSFDGRIMAGALLNSFPEQDYEYTDGEGNNFEYDMQPSNSTSFAFDAGVGVRCLIAQFRREKLCAMINLDYLYSSAFYNTEQNIYEIPVTGPNAGYQVQLFPSNSYSGTIPIELLNITFGLGYQF